jgi:hypothetical protein
MNRFSLPLVFCCLILVGCKSPPPTESSWLASVIIPEKTDPQIRMVALSIFEKEGYKAQIVTAKEIVLEKPGGTMNNLLYGDLTSGVWIRVKLRVRQHGPDGQILECNAYRVSNKGDRVFEEERLYRRSGSFQKLLDKVKAELQRAGAPEGPAPGASPKG